MTQRTVYSVIDNKSFEQLLPKTIRLFALCFYASASMRDKIVTLTSALFTHAN